MIMSGLLLVQAALFIDHQLRNDGWMDNNDVLLTCGSPRTKISLLYLDTTISLAILPVFDCADLRL